MTYNVFGGTLNLAQSQPRLHLCIIDHKNDIDLVY